jgi:16S rRNA (cytosine967-C5)-methyltransferase
VSEPQLTSREVALRVLRAVRVDDAYANLLLPQLIDESNLDARDAALATELTYGTLRWQGLYDAIAQRCIDREWELVDPDIVDILRLGAHQLLHMRIPPHAAVDTSCALARKSGSPGGASGRAGFVNAVLRAISAHDVAEWQKQLNVAEAMSHPEWIVRALGDALGERRSELPELLLANNEPARPSVVARPGRMTPEELLAHRDVEPGRWSPLAGTLVRGAPEHIDAIRDGSAGVQDEGSQLVALALTRVPVEGPETRWLDMCAGPGGKAAILAGIAAERGIAFSAVEIHPHRAALVTQAIPDVDIYVGDARSHPWGSGLCDRVMVDAPCTGIGALRRRPDSRWRRTPADLTQLGPLQRDLLQSAIDATRIGGVIAYVTCSPHLVETADVLHAVLKRREDVQLLDAPQFLPEVTDAAEGKFVQLWPHRHGTDAMFLALLRRM